MPITLDEFDRLPDDALDLTKGSNAHRVLMFLAEHPDAAFRQQEFLERLDVKAGSIGPVLSRLEDRGVVRHKGKYWTLGNDERLASYTAMSQTFATVDDRLPPEDQEEWLAHAEDPYADDRREDT